MTNAEHRLFNLTILFLTFIFEDISSSVHFLDNALIKEFNPIDNARNEITIFLICKIIKSEGTVKFFIKEIAPITQNIVPVIKPFIVSFHYPTLPCILVQKSINYARTVKSRVFINLNHNFCNIISFIRNNKIIQANFISIVSKL